MIRAEVRAGMAESDDGLPSFDEIRSERTIAFIRVAIIAVVAAVYLGSIGVQRSLGPLAVSILALAAVYSLWAVLARPYETRLLGRFQAATLLVDAALITLWCKATGGPESEFWTLFLIVIIAVALRFDLLETLVGALGVALLYVMAMSVDGGLGGSQVLVRPSIMMITGFAVGVLAHQRRQHRDAQEAMERVLDEHRRVLEDEKAVVSRLQQVDVAKSEFVAVASHEFRTPLSAIIGVLSTLRSHGDALEPELRQELLDGASTQAARLARLVEDLLTVSRIEDGAMQLEIAPVHPERLVFEAAQASGTADRLDVHLNGVDRVLCDADRIVRVLANLLDNARKYSPLNGRIWLSVEEDEANVRFVVRDQGRGVPPDQRERIFDRFRRLVQEPRAPGAGLGLYISRCLVEAHGGQIGVGEAPGGGAEFSFTLPKVAWDGPSQSPGDQPADRPQDEVEIFGAVH